MNEKVASIDYKNMVLGYKMLLSIYIYVHTCTKYEEMDVQYNNTISSKKKNPNKAYGSIKIA